MRKKSRRRIGECGYNPCKKRTFLFRCKYCGDYFCQNHVKPTLVTTMRDIWETPQPDKDIKQKAWRETEVHPCWPYAKEFWAKIEMKRKKEAEIMKEILDRKKLDRKKAFELAREESRAREEYKSAQIQAQIEYDIIPWLKRNLPKLFIIFIIVFVALLFLSHKYPGQPLDKQVKSFLTEIGINLKNGNVTGKIILQCHDGTLELECSKNKPFRCINKTLVKDAKTCGCPLGYRLERNDCMALPRCSDDTFYGECSKIKPLYCLNGTLINKSSICGCAFDEVSEGEICISKYLIEPINRSFRYTVKGITGSIDLILYTGLKNHLASLSRSYTCTPECPSNRDIELYFLDEEKQKPYLKELVKKIESQTNNTGDRARIAISLVQKISYDLGKFYNYSITTSGRYPYEVLYDNKGICGEKSKLLAFLLRELGFGVVLFEYDKENHMAVGIKCPFQYSYKNTGYCFIEVAAPSIPTDDQGDYVGVGKLTSFSIINLSDGISFESIIEEYNDAMEWNRIKRLAESSGGYLESYPYYKWFSLVEKYGIEQTEK